MPERLKPAYVLSLVVGALMLVQSVLGLAFHELYRDIEWIKLTWFGNDWVTLVVALPLLALALALARRGAVLGRLLWAGMLGYAAYNYAFYLFGVALNEFLPLYVALVALSVAALILLLSRIDVPAVAASFRPETPVRAVGGYLVFVAVTLSAVWLGMWGAYVFAGRPTPVEPEAFKLVAALDLTLMVPAMAVGGILLWRRAVWGYVIAAMAGIQAAIYLLVLTVNTLLSISEGLSEAPGELVIWGPLLVATTVAMVVLLSNARGRRA